VPFIHKKEGMAMSTHKTKNVFLKASDLFVDRALNVRLDYDVPSMVESIRRVGRITDPIHVWLKDDGKYTVIRGNRRASGAHVIENENLPEDQDVIKELQKIPCIVYEGLTEKEAFDLVLDQGDQKTLNKAEIAKAVWRCVDQGMVPDEIYSKMYQALALMTGQLKKAHEAEQIRSAADRKVFFKNWFKGTVDQFLMYAWECGPMVQEQVLLNLLQSTRPLTDEEKSKVRFACTRKVVTELYNARKNDRNKGLWNQKKRTGPEFEEIIRKHEMIYTTGEAPESEPVAKKMTFKAIEGMSEQFRSSDLTTLANVILGKDQANLIVLDEDAFKLEMIIEELRSAQNDLKGIRKELVQAILSLDLENVKNVLYAKN